MATNTENKILGLNGTERLVAIVKNLLSGKATADHTHDELYMKDRVTGTVYNIYVSNGSLMMEESEV